MREQVMVHPPSIERRKASFSVSKKEEALLDTSKENKKWVVSEEKHAEKIRGFFLSSRDQQQALEAESVSAEKMKAEGSKESEEAPAEPVQREEQQEKACVEARLARERMKNLASSSAEGALLLQWGQRKRSRCSRLDNHNFKPPNLVDDSPVLSRKTVRIQADKVSAASQPSTSPLACKRTLQAKNGVIAKREHLWSPCNVVQVHANPPEEKRKRAKVLKEGPSDVRQERKELGGKRGYTSHTHKQDQSLHQSKTFTLPDPKSASPDRCLTGGNEASLSNMDLVWPRFVISLSRKEKEEDFLILKGTKLPQRPKRRPKAVERALHYCAPGSWLIDMSHSRYDVKEKKSVRKRPRGLKAMESMDSDSEC